ncbi:MAG: class I SAM-dependent methyltransferase [Rhodospirillaceae bacterium]|jgi:cyclopropane-fatty-acyl-phospholipid synthase|nr:class I SAM-dependent methyltransferase [Rhodospirillaceae bacterium]MBT4588950.1 class I SAM-dependent methyltransferase [Rhodospirillaceae bacterium]MBT5941163.1 class I SAM-dependent methyltransferase [Rhodospirillaceae bacterium]MBT7265362.1 class I SAM-dependent methyltransferase [Rhodospirillaceae bacterium]
MYLLQPILSHMIKIGSLKIVNADGKIYRFSGQKSDLVPNEVCVHFHDNGYANWLALSPSMALGKGYMEDQLSVEGGTIYDFLQILSVNVENDDYHWLHRFLESLDGLRKRFLQFNPASKSRKNVAHHYDLSGELYRLFLDKDRQYSCAYFAGPENDLDTAQTDKKSHIAAKLLLERDHKVLDIGSGWGGMGLYIARHFGAQVEGITLSEEQLKESNQRAKLENLNAKAQFHLKDYRTVTEKFDRIVSVGMFEHVGINHYAKYFGKIHDCLNPDGVALLHTIGRIGSPSVTDPWIRKYIFPGGYIPSLSEIMPAIEKSGLIASDVEFLGLHYAETLRHWQQCFQANRGKVRNIYDETFCRMWEYYLSCSEVSFRHLDSTVFQIQLVKDRRVVPMTRDYMANQETALREAIANDNRAA